MELDRGDKQSATIHKYCYLALIIVCIYAVLLHFVTGHEIEFMFKARSDFHNLYCILALCIQFDNLGSSSVIQHIDDGDAITGVKHYRLILWI